MAQQPDPYALDGVKSRENPPSKGLGGVFFLILLALAGLMLSPFPEKVRRKLGLVKAEPAQKEAPQPEPRIVIQEKVVTQTERVPPPYYQVTSGTRVDHTSKGFDFRYGIEEQPGGLASEVRKKDGTYEVSFTVSVAKPEPAKTLEELAAVNALLPEILPALEEMMRGAKVSPFFQALYENKRDRIQSNLKKFDRLLTKHNYYDCQTMLEMTHPESGRRVFIAQSDMDVVADGSDGDRLATMPEEIVNSAYYQPFTSYGWPKTGTVENPMIVGWRRMLEVERGKASPSASKINRLKLGIEDMQKRSFLIAEYDPFIVIPVYVIRDRESPFGPNVGDYVAVIYQNKVYPAIVGDGGPSFKFGEASLRMAKALNARATPNHRPVSDVSVTYVVFPRTSVAKWVAPNYETWRSECQRLLGEIGGLGEGYELERWENTLPTQ